MLLPFKSLQNDVVFEELCYKLLKKIGFQNVRWRGPGADGGRDIEAEWYFIDPSGHSTIQRWFIECKFYTGSVSFSDVEPKLLAANTLQKDCLLLITSSSLKNTCLDQIETWLSRRDGRPNFRYWNGTDVTEKIICFPELMEEYFPAHSVLPSQMVMQELTKMEVQIHGIDERIKKSISSLCQSIIGNCILQEEGLTVNINKIRQDSTLMQMQLEALKALTGYLEADPTKKIISFNKCLREVIDICNNRYKKAIKVTLPEDEFFLKTSSSLFKVILFETISNASLYSQGDINLVVTKDIHGWLMKLKNSSGTELVLDRWPEVGKRHPASEKLNPSGLGQGCWISNHLSSVLGFSINWECLQGDWTVTLSGVAEYEQ